MNEPGYIYVLTNPSMEGLLKIGKTTRDPSDRITELSSATGVPTPFVLAYDEYFNDCTKAERFIHTQLEIKGYRTSSNREFFNVPLKEIIKIIISAKNSIDSLSDENITNECSNNFQLIKQEPWEEIYEMAEEYYFGLDETLQDYTEAFKLYKQAYNLGSPKSCQKLGEMSLYGEGCTPNKHTALEYFKEGVKRSAIECHAEMALFFIKENNLNNALKCWNLFIKNCFNPNIVIDDFYIRYIIQYIKFCVLNNIKIECFDEVSSYKNSIYNYIYKYQIKNDEISIYKANGIETLLLMWDILKESNETNMNNLIHSYIDNLLNYPYIIIEDMHKINQGIVFTGILKNGILKIGENLHSIFHKNIYKVLGIENSGNLINQANEGMAIGVLVNTTAQITIGDIMVAKKNTQY